MKDESYYAGRDLVHPTRPHRPTTQANANSKELREHADRLEAYEEAMETFKSEKAAYNAAIRARREELMYDLAADHNLTDAQARVLFNRAWEDGHSGGINEVIMIFYDLYDLVINFNSAQK